MESDEINFTDINDLQNNSLENIQYLAFLLGFKQPSTESEKIRTVNKIESLFDTISTTKSRIDNDDNIKLFDKEYEFEDLIINRMV